MEMFKEDSMTKIKRPRAINLKLWLFSFFYLTYGEYNKYSQFLKLQHTLPKFPKVKISIDEGVGGFK